MVSATSALANNVRRTKQQRSALLDRHKLPGLERLQRRLHCLLGMLSPSLLMNANNLRRPRWVPRLNLAARLHPLAANDQRILMPQQVPDALERPAHGSGILMLRKVDERLIAKRALRFARQDNGGKSESSHINSSLVQNRRAAISWIADAMLLFTSTRISCIPSPPLFSKGPESPANPS
jgi:hypothetical protein